MSNYLDELDIDLYNAQSRLSNIQDNFQNLREEFEAMEDKLEFIKGILKSEMHTEENKLREIEWILERC